MGGGVDMVGGLYKSNLVDASLENAWFPTL
jgi:hypothetical protein